MSPMKPRPPCAAPGCPGLAEPGRRHCVKHASVGARERAESRARYTERRGTVAERGYGSRWRRFRAMRLREDPDCQKCGALATDVHHLVKKADGGEDSVENTICLCHACHSRITGAGG